MSMGRFWPWMVGCSTSCRGRRLVDGEYHVDDSEALRESVRIEVEEEQKIMSKY